MDMDVGKQQQHQELNLRLVQTHNTEYNIRSSMVHPNVYTLILSVIRAFYSAQKAFAASCELLAASLDL